MNMVTFGHHIFLGGQTQIKWKGHPHFSELNCGESQFFSQEPPIFVRKTVETINNYGKQWTLCPLFCWKTMEDSPPPPQEDIQKSDEEIRVTAAGSVSVGALREQTGGSANFWRLILPNYFLVI